ncbi:hypothetical protein JRC04_05330 [Mycolicibacterium sp. S2-37]|uniref:hypothetical protein n=1 Tax=Mycolicibacterium sp. S2-37 TaxID=2810297 RepID=UPI001A940D48|nr:hypothetical protein [Mycolicibacterium sp. S2-37]MBO0676877.1 hypothetical protein [Mycolicibacterium sp. S2-37]
MTNYLSTINWSGINIDHCLEHSFKDFHAKGLDYVCLTRTPEITVKAYFFEGLDQKPGEVINPHDHRYPFDTQCLSGVIRNKWFRAHPLHRPGLTEMYERFEWMTPLNGGDGFNWIGMSALENYRVRDFVPGSRYFMQADELHTIQVMEPETVIVLMQFADVVPVDEPTYTYAHSAEPPSLKGLYSEFKPDELIKRLRLLEELAAKL